jgi:peptidoglycan hydrolase CwlO-like protein
MWHDKLEIHTVDDIRWKVSNLEQKIRKTNIEIVDLTSHRDSLKNELKIAKQRIDTVTENHIMGPPI